MKASTLSKIVLVHSGIGDSIAPAFEEQGYRVLLASTAKEALALAEKERPAVIVVDANGLRLDVERLCRAVKRVCNAAVIMVDAPLALPNKDANDAGESPRIGCADAYFARPFMLKRLLAKVEKLQSQGAATELRCGDLVLFPHKNLLQKRGEVRRLTPKLSRLLRVLMERQGEVVLRKDLMRDVWDTTYLGDTRTLDVHIHWLRQLIEDDPTQPVYLFTVRGKGYRLDNPKRR
ncbi:MAG: response regulator transcription factor [Thermoflexales bacterium]|nr:response regulator transcription factor [Thermoflexales bacterium]MDW8292506.1 response regulator transcription factor [Anaerolineae bacterium]